MVTVGILFGGVLFQDVSERGESRRNDVERECETIRDEVFRNSLIDEEHDDEDERLECFDEEMEKWAYSEIL